MHISDAETQAFGKGSVGRGYAQDGKHEEAEKNFAEALTFAQAIPERMVANIMLADLWAMRAENQSKWGIKLEQSGNVSAAREHYKLGVQYISKALQYRPGYPPLLELYNMLRSL